MSIVAVAKKAGVSIATVSRVLNEADGVRSQTAEQVHAAIREIGYTPPIVKRGPKGGRRRSLPAGLRTGQIAVLNLSGSPYWLGLPVMASVVHGATRAAKELDIRPILDEMTDGGEISPMIRRREVDGGIVFVPPHVSEQMIESLRKLMPIVWVMGGKVHMPEVDHIAPDNIGIGQLAHQYLQSRGCKHLAFINDHPNAHYKRLRGQGFGNAALESGQCVMNFLVNPTKLEAAACVGETVSAATLEALVDEIAKHSPRPTGLFVPTDWLTTMIYPLLMKRGIMPERDIKLISCDNEQERLAMLSPRPASIDIRSEELGRLAVRQLVHRLQRPNDPAVRMQTTPWIPPIP